MRRPSSPCGCDEQASGDNNAEQYDAAADKPATPTPTLGLFEQRFSATSCGVDVTSVPTHWFSRNEKRSLHGKVEIISISSSRLYPS